MNVPAFCAALVLGGLGGWPHAAPSLRAAAQTRPATRPASIAAPTPGRFRDPTEPDPRLRDALSAGRDLGTTRPVPRAPQVIRRGFVQVAGQAPEAIIEVKGSGMYLVREGDSISVAVGTTADSLPMRIGKISADGIEIEFSTETLIVR